MKFFRIFSFEPVSKSASAQFRYCPTCKTERTIEYRDEKTYFAFLRMPLWPVTETSTVPRCLSCRNTFFAHDLQKAAAQHRAQISQRTVGIIGAFLIFYDFNEIDFQQQVANQIAADESDDFLELLQQFIQHTDESEWLLFVSRQCDTLPADIRSQILDTVSKLFRAGEKPVEIRLRVEQFANAMGFGQNEITNWIDRHLP